MGRVVSPTPTPLSSGRVVPALVASYDMHGRAVGLFYTQPIGQCVPTMSMKSCVQPCLYVPSSARQDAFYSNVSVFSHEHGRTLCSIVFVFSTKYMAGVVVYWLLNVPGTYQCISGTDLLRQFSCCHTEKLQIKLSLSLSHSILTTGQPVPALTL